MIGLVWLLSRLLFRGVGLLDGDLRIVGQPVGSGCDHAVSGLQTFNNLNFISLPDSGFDFLLVRAAVGSGDHDGSFSIFRGEQAHSRNDERTGDGFGKHGDLHTGAGFQPVPRILRFYPNLDRRAIGIQSWTDYGDLRGDWLLQAGGSDAGLVTDFERRDLGLRDMGAGNHLGNVH